MKLENEMELGLGVGIGIMVYWAGFSAFKV